MRILHTTETHFEANPVFREVDAVFREVVIASTLDDVPAIGTVIDVDEAPFEVEVVHRLHEAFAAALDDGEYLFELKIRRRHPGSADTGARSRRRPPDLNGGAQAGPDVNESDEPDAQ